jgi:hypothetical protein
VEYGLALILLAALVAVVVLRPLVRGVDEETGSVTLEELEAAKEAKYREIRDARLDFEMGKLTREDFRAIDRDLRAEAIELLKQLDSLEGRDVR